ncbi:RING-type domain-containing protein [Citrus sinensis]|uniref:RING-type domain-containing protein n=1 Tax=Citrus sinensis TaxID=2711 RepID=A0ACB8MQ51_CITSI|nr:RING-type domain-containing protein [Citrus sinensis]
MGIENKFGKTICSICYEDLKPIVEDLQVISICGHVFHELCLQQWFEYCSSSKKCTCPVCKQRCSSSNVSRLYFQSIGDQIDLVISQKPKDPEVEDPEVSRAEVKILEVKVSRLHTVLESQGKEIKEINEEELDKVTLECLKLKQRNMDLAKELASLKLVSDLNLDEDEVLKFALLGNGANNKDTIDVLRKSLVIRNKNYTELMAKCNLLGREKARFSEKLEKAKEKINKLKTRVQELETAVELKDNEVLRALKVSKKASQKEEILKGATEDNSISLCTNNVSLEDQREQHSVPIYNLDWTSRVTNDFSFSTKSENFNAIKNIDANHTREGGSAKSHGKERNALQREDTSRFSSVVFGLSNHNSIHQTIADVVQKPTPSRLGSAPTIDIDEDVTLIVPDSAQVQPIVNIKKNPPSPVSLSKPGDVCFSSGVLGPDGTNRYLGKWCKRGQMKGSNIGDLITVGADGRASTSFMQDGKENLSCAKRLKYGAKTSSVQSQGSLQIEHFFGRVGH